MKIVKILKDDDWMNNPIVSCGVGKGIMEWHLKQECPEIDLTCPDFTSEAIEKLKKVFINLEHAQTFDMLDGDYASFQRDAVVMKSF